MVMEMMMKRTMIHLVMENTLHIVPLANFLASHIVTLSLFFSLSLSLSLSLYLSLSFLARSCLLITLIKCLKGRKSLGSLCML